MNNDKKSQFINSRTIAQTQEENQAANEVILRAVEKKIKSKKDLQQIQNGVCEEFGSTLLTQPILLNKYRELVKDRKIIADDMLFQILRKRRIRTSSGVAPVAILTKPFPCPGKCIYCPSEPDMPKSYISNEPAVMRAILADFDPVKQIEIRLRGLEIAGNPADKIELIVMGGTWSALPKDYQLKFIIACYTACNNFAGKFSIFNFQFLINSQISNDQLIKQLVYEQKKNELAKYRIIGLTLETRPDYINEDEIKWMRMLGCTRVELGVQSLNERVLNKNNRGHKVVETIKATKLLKNAGFKICYHMMPNLYGSNLKQDLQMFEELFSNPDFQPDMIKIYSCVVTKYSELEKLYHEKKYIPYSDIKLVELITKIKRIIPPYVRILRLGRDIPADNIVGGSKMSNIRQIVQDKMKNNACLPVGMELGIMNYGCKCIRCREIREDTKLPVKLERIDYDASGGKEIFLQYIDDNNRLYALLRLRIPSVILNDSEESRDSSEIPQNDSQFKSFSGSALVSDGAIVREVHTYGPLVEVDSNQIDAKQHHGLGKQLILEAERITKEEFHLNNIAVISGVGARDYYRKLGYNLSETYMTKKFKTQN